MNHREQVAAYFKQHPGERLRYEQVAAAVHVDKQRASITLSAMLRFNDLPGLARVGRGSYQFDPPVPTETDEDGAEVPAGA